jgi:class 3 adenylate cyclase/tetratricopeptide (TPR) repeat protein/energy-coupling factor transporter ATP-binding protein EcfA2
MDAIETVTILFTDQVGSTELSQRLSPAAADDVRRGHFSILRQAVAESGGTEVKNLGDGLMVVFTSASAALRCAVAMQQTVERENRGGEHSVGLRVGLSAGEVSKESGDYFGDPVVEAARLCAACTSGQILAADVVRATAGRRNPHNFRSLGGLTLKGLPGPLETHEIAWTPLEELAPTIVPLPARLSHRPTVGVIGRELELTALDAAIKRVSSGGGRELLLVTGEPGQGKTTLVSELARQCHEADMTVLLGRCDEEVGAPYRPFHEALNHFVAHADEELLRAHVASYGGELVRMAPALRQRLGELPEPQNSDAETGRYLLYAAAVGLLQAASAERAAVLVIDDLHWADKPSLQLLRHIVSDAPAARLFIIGTYRDAELSAAHPLTEALGGLLREPGVSSLSLKGLDDSGVIAFLESAAGHELDEAGVGLAHQVSRETDGNPFFVSEVLRHLSEVGAIVQGADGRWNMAEVESQLALPNSVRAVVGSRLARLGDEATRLLSMAAVIGRDFDLDLLVSATGSDEDSAIDLLDRARHATLITELADTPGRYSFAHALIQHTLYEDLGATKRTRAHRTVGEAIERLSGKNSDLRIDELARHFLLATTPSDLNKAIVYAQRAGEAALAALAPDDAVRYFTQALELVGPGAGDDPARHIDLLIGLGTAQRQAGEATFRETLLDAARRARELGDTGRLVASALANSRGWFSSFGQVDAEKVGVIEAALAALPTTDSPERARLLATLCSELLYDRPLEQRMALAEEAKAIARRLGDPATLVAVACRCGVALYAGSTLASQLAEFAEVAALALDLEDPQSQFLAANAGSVLAFCAGQFDLARERLELQQSIASRLGQPFLLWVSKCLDTLAALWHGNSKEAEEFASVALELGMASGEPDAFGVYGNQLMCMREQQGRMGELVSLIADTSANNPTVPTFKAALAAACLDGGDNAAARQLVDEAAVDSFALPVDGGWFDGKVEYARVVIELELGLYAEQLIEQLAPYRDQALHDGFLVLPPVATFLGGLATVIGRYEDAESYFTQASELNVRGEMRYAEAFTNLLWGRMLQRRGGPGDAVRAQTLLEQARESGASRGYALVERRAAEALASLA